MRVGKERERDGEGERKSGGRICVMARCPHGAPYGDRERDGEGERKSGVYACRNVEKETGGEGEERERGGGSHMRVLSISAAHIYIQPPLFLSPSPSLSFPFPIRYSTVLHTFAVPCAISGTPFLYLNP